jgi:hypothetical protein
MLALPGLTTMALMTGRVMVTSLVSATPLAAVAMTRKPPAVAPAVNRPPVVMLPPLVDQVTLGLVWLAPLLSVALTLNC